MGLQETLVVFGGMNDTTHPELLPENQSVLMRDLYPTGGAARITPRKFCLSLPEELGSHKVRWFTVWDRGESRVVLFIDDSTGRLYSFLWEQQTNARNIRNCAPVSLRDNTPVICDDLGVKITTAESADQIWIFGAKDLDGLLCPIRYDGSRARLESGIVRSKGEGATTGVFYEERLVLASFANPSRLYWTDPNDFGAIPPDNWLEVYPYDNDSITGLLVYAGTIIVLKNSHVYRVVSIPPADVRIVSSRRGCPTGDAVVLNNLVYFRDDTGHVVVTDGGDEHINDVSRGVLDSSLVTKGLPTPACKQMLKEGTVSSLFGCEQTQEGAVKPKTLSREKRPVGCPASDYDAAGLRDPVLERREFLLQLAKPGSQQGKMEYYCNCALQRFGVFLRNPSPTTQPTVRAKLVTGRAFEEYYGRLRNDAPVYLFRDIPGVESRNAITLKPGAVPFCVFEFAWPYAPMPESGLNTQNEKPHAIILSTYDAGTGEWGGEFGFPIESARKMDEPVIRAAYLLAGKTKWDLGTVVGGVCSGNPDGGNTTTYIDTIEALPFVTEGKELITWTVTLSAEMLRSCLLAKRGRVFFDVPAETVAKLGLTVIVRQRAPGRERKQGVVENPTDFSIVPLFSPSEISFTLSIATPDKRAYVWECQGIECWVIEGDRDAYAIAPSIHATHAGLFFPNTDPTTGTSELVRLDPAAGFAKITTGRLRDPSEETALSPPMVKLVDTTRDLVIYVPATHRSGRAFVFFSDLDRTTQELLERYRFEPFLEPQPMAISRRVPLTALRHHHALPRRITLRFSDFGPPPYAIVVPEAVLDDNTKSALGAFVLNSAQKVFGMSPRLTRSIGVRLRFPDISVLHHRDLVVLPARVEWSAVGLASKDDAVTPPDIQPGES